MSRAVCLGVLLFVSAVHAGGGTLRVGSQVLVAGDSATRVLELLGKPSYRTHAAAPAERHGGRRKSRGSRGSRGRSTTSGGEQWQYRQGTRIVTIVIVDGKVSTIGDIGR